MPISGLNALLFVFGAWAKLCTENSKIDSI